MFTIQLRKLAQTLDDLVKIGKIPAELSLARKLEAYQRMGIVQGIIDPSCLELHEATKQKLYSLGDIIGTQRSGQQTALQQFLETQRKFEAKLYRRDDEYIFVPGGEHDRRETESFKNL